MIHDKFSQFVNDKIVEWNSKNDEKRGNKFPVLSSMAKILKDTTLVSGKSFTYVNKEMEDFINWLKAAKEKEEKEMLS